MTKRKLFAIYLAIMAAAAGCGLVQGGGVAKCPTDAECAWITVYGERLYLCGTPAQIKALQAKASSREVQK